MKSFFSLMSKGVINIRLLLILTWRMMRNILGDSLWWGFHEFPGQRSGFPTEPNLLILLVLAEMNARSMLPQEPASYFLTASLISLQLIFHFIARLGKTESRSKNTSSILYQLCFFSPDHLGTVWGPQVCVCPHSSCVSAFRSWRSTHMLLITRVTVILSLSRVWLLATPWTVACQAPLSMGFSTKEYWEWAATSFSRGSFQPRDQTCISCIAGDSLPPSRQGSPSTWVHACVCTRSCMCVGACVFCTCVIISECEDLHLKTVPVPACSCSVGTCVWVLCCKHSSVLYLCL